MQWLDADLEEKFANLLDVTFLFSRSVRKTPLETHFVLYSLSPDCADGRHVSIFWAEGQEGKTLFITAVDPWPSSDPDQEGLGQPTQPSPTRPPKDGNL